MFTIMASARQPAARPARALRIGSFAAIGDAPVEPTVTAAFMAACAVLRAQGHEVTPIAPLWDPDAVNTLFGLFTAAGVARVMASIPEWENRVTASIAQQALRGLTLSATDYLQGLDRLAVFRAGMLDAIENWDVIATPSSPALPWPRTSPYPTLIAGQIALPRTAAIFSTAINLAGLPAIIVPAPVLPGALPVGLQLVGSSDTEDLLLDLAGQFERVSPWCKIAPMAAAAA
jgi:Asp-tRNA(Asn)/Glu-tRNA(Gln) amidotransferase A subunit family amidase